MVIRNLQVKSKIFSAFFLLSSFYISSISYGAAENNRKVDTTVQVKAPEVDTSGTKMLYHAAKKYLKSVKASLVKDERKKSTGEKIKKAFKKLAQKITGKRDSKKHELALKLKFHSKWYYKGLKSIVFHGAIRDAARKDIVISYMDLKRASGGTVPTYLSDAYEKWEKLHDLEKRVRHAGYLF